MGFQLVSTTTVTSPVALIEFTDIPQDGVDLLVVYSLRNSDTGTADSLLLNFNSSTANFTSRRLLGTGSTVSSSSSTREIIGGITGNGATASTFSNCQLYISNYTSSAAKSWSADAVTENNDTLVRHAITAGLWNDTSALTSILVSGGYDFVAGSTASLYKVS